MTIIEVVWDDAHCSTGEITVKSAAKTKPIRTRTIGYLVAENDDGIVMATDTYEKHPKAFRMNNFIPWGMVVEYWEII